MKCKVCKASEASVIGCFGLTCNDGDCNHLMSVSPQYYVQMDDHGQPHNTEIQRYRAGIGSVAEIDPWGW